jgi:energy-coupling factor transporter ATP-binding protein EcfA2/energy-coupling factor transporter transmembrane protein EcfT
MSALTVQGLSYTYPSASAPSVCDVDLRVGPGELVLISGPTGCGKSTLLRLMAGLLQRHGQGRVSGTVSVLGHDPALTEPSERVGLLGFVGQEPDDQLVAGTLGDELAFAMESAGWEAARIEARLGGLLEAVGLDLELDRSTQALSGGQCQRLVTGAALGAGARVLLLDEPLAQLDPAGARVFMERLRALCDGGVSAVLVEHRLHLVTPWCDRFLLMDEGAVVAVDPDEAELAALGLRSRPSVEAGPVEEPGEVLLALRGLRHRYEGATQDALQGVDLELRAGERVALLGANGSGKSTLLRCVEETSGGGVSAVPQDPDLALFCETVRDELAYGPREWGLDEAAAVSAAATALSLTELLDRAPQALSRGQRLRTAVGAALACRPRVLLLDEPTAGQDHEQVERMFGALRTELASAAVVFATHDEALAARHATRVLRMSGGRLVSSSAVDSPVGAAVPSSASAPRPGLDPRTRLGLLLCAGLLAIALEQPFALGLLTFLCAVPLVALRPSWTWWRRGGVLVLAVVWSTALSQGLFYAEQPRVPLVQLGPLVVWEQGLVYGLAQSLRFVALALGGIALAVSTSPDRMFAALRALRMPFGLALMTATALRFLPRIGAEVLTVRRARAARGRPAWRRSPSAWLRLELSLLRPTVARSWRRAQALAESLDTRGFDALAPRGVRRPLRMSGLDWGLIGLGLLVTLGVCWARVMMLLYTSETLYLQALRPLYGFVRDWI